MRASSAFTCQSDPYRAGLELGEALATVAPEVVFLFSSVGYGKNADLVEGLNDALDNPSLIVIGNSGDGVYQTRHATDMGAAALGINSEGSARWYLVSEPGIKAAPALTTRRAWQRLAKQGLIDLVFMVSDFRTDASQIETILSEEVPIPVVGGLAADDNRMHYSFVYANREVLRDAVVMLGCHGTFAFDIAVGNSLQPVGQPGQINASDGTCIHRIDGMPAMDFIERETGKPVLQSDRGIVSLTIVNPDAPAEKRLRSIVPDFSTDAGHLGLYGGIENGKLVQVCLASPEQLLQEVQAIAERARTATFEPKAAIIVSCGGRKHMLGPRIEHEVSALSAAFPKQLPLVGFPSFGEIAPLKNDTGYTRNLFHNMTYVLLLLGE